MNDNIGKRRRPDRTPDQIARKRDQDREAQRLSRERTRRRIEEAESRLAESQATTANYERELKRAIEEREAAQDEASSLKKQLESTCAQLDAARAHLASVLHLLGSKGSHANSPNIAPLETTTMPFFAGQVPQLQSPQASEICQPRRSSARSDHLYFSNMQHASASPTSSMARETSNQAMPKLNTTSSGSPYYGTDASAYGSPCSVASWHDMSVVLPKNSAPNCPMDSILAIFSNTRRDLLQQGEPESTVLGSRAPALSVLSALCMQPDMRAHHPVSKMVAEVMSKVPVLIRIPEQIAVLWLSQLILRFTILPNRENWDALPEWYRPIHSQAVHPHPRWIDHVPWPQLRSTLAERHTEFPQEDFFLPYFEGLSINWPYNPMDTYIKDESTGELIVSPAFEAHLRTLESWSLGRVFSRAYPTLAGTYRST